MVFSRTVLFVALICAVGFISAASTHRRQVRSPFTPELQTWVAKTADKQVKLATKIGRLIKILPPKADNETAGEVNSTSTNKRSPFTFFGTIPLKIVSVIRGTKAENTTVEDEEPVTEQEGVTLPEQVVEVEAKPVEAAPKPRKVKPKTTQAPPAVTETVATEETEENGSDPEAMAL